MYKTVYFLLISLLCLGLKAGGPSEGENNSYQEKRGIKRKIEETSSLPNNGGDSTSNEFLEFYSSFTIPNPFRILPLEQIQFLLKQPLSFNCQNQATYLSMPNILSDPSYLSLFSEHLQATGIAPRLKGNVSLQQANENTQALNSAKPPCSFSALEGLREEDKERVKSIRSKFSQKNEEYILELQKAARYYLVQYYPIYNSLKMTVEEKKQAFGSSYRVKLMRLKRTLIQEHILTENECGAWNYKNKMF